MYTLQTEQFVPYPVEQVFPFFEAPENLANITPEKMGFNILTPSPIEMKEGTLIDYTIRLAGFQIHWRTLITRYNPPHTFVDEQLKGPYTFWHHTHSFESVEGGTMLRDTVRYMMPLGWIGKLVHALFVRRQLQSIFSYRKSIIAKQFPDANVESH